MGQPKRLPAKADTDRLVRSRLLTIAEVRERLNVKNEKTVRALVDEGALPSVRVGRLLRVPEAGVDDYLRKQLED